MYICKQFKEPGKLCSKLFSSFFCGLIILAVLTEGLSFAAATDVGVEEYSFAEATEDEGKRAEEIRAELNAQIEELTNQVEKYQESVREIRAQAGSLERELSLLDNQIKKFELEIKRMKLIIGGIESEIRGVELNVKELEQQTQDEKVILGELIREIYKYDETSFLEIILTKENLSDFFSELQSLENLQIELQKSLEEIRVFKKYLAIKGSELEEHKNEILALKAIEETQKYSLEKKKGEHKKLLDETKGQEYLYQRLIKSKQLDVNTIRSQLYILQGMGGSLSFENALSLAEFASSVTGVRPAFLLAVLSKESGWGVNVGKGTWRIDMNPNQHSAYLSICEKVGVNPDMMPVSKKAWYGWGGAMGPAQFLPRTWLGYESRIAQITGHNPPSPWDIEDAFVASALYLANAGAGEKTYNAEWKAAMIYLAGNNWWKSYLRFYGDQVMDLAAAIQEQINLIK